MPPGGAEGGGWQLMMALTLSGLPFAATMIEELAKSLGDGGR